MMIQGRWSEVKDKEREKEREQMTLCLYECLRAVGLQRHHAKFTSVGVHSAAHLSGLTMEDYPVLGIRSMEERTRLFNLVQMIKTLDLESLEYEDCNDNDDDDYGSDEGYAVADSSITFDGRGVPDEDIYDDEDEEGAGVSKLNADSFYKPSGICRRLDFSSETIDHHEKPFSHPICPVNVCGSHNGDTGPGHGKRSVIPVQLEHDTGNAVVSRSNGNNNERPDVHSRHSHHRTGGNTRPDFSEEISMSNSHSRLSPKCVSSHKLKPRPGAVASKSFSNKPVWHRDGKGISRKEKLYTEISSNMSSEHMTNAKPVYESKRTAGYNYGLPLSSPPTPNKKQPGGPRISVCVRKRPLTRTEYRRGEADVVTAPSGECVIVHESKEAVDLTQYILQHRYYFDQVFGEESSNEEVYQRTAYPLVQHMLNGGKATCFAYGQTGAGKTHTMLGSSSGKPGLYVLAVRDIFAHLSTSQIHTPLLVYVSFFEIYCGQLYDLLDHRKRLFAREDGQRVVHIAGLRDVRVDSVSSLLEVISHGTEERTQGISGVNPLSSRSHALLQIQLKGPNQQIAGRMWFVDLAGSERASDTKEPDKQSRMEGAEINQSLLALKECIRSLDQEQSHTPFRQSKLTQVLKDSFVGDSMTCMIANISPGHLATEHTLNTLRYADRVKELRGHGRLRGEGRSRTVPSPKRNLSNSSNGGSSIGTRGKSPPKKPKLGRHREAFGPSTPTSRLATGSAVICSTPKNSRWGEETSAKARKEIGLEHITPIRGLLGIVNKRESGERAGEREDRGRERYEGNDGAINDKKCKARLVLEQATDEQLHLWKVQQESGFYHRDKENQQSTLKRGREGGRRSMNQRRQMESDRDICTDVEKLRERDLQRVDDRGYEERERHLRRYHQQLQQFMPSSAPSSDHLFSPSTCLSVSSSNQASLSSSVPVTGLVYHGLEEVLDAYRARAEVRADGDRGQLSSFPSGEICLQTETPPSYTKNKYEVSRGDSGGPGEGWELSLEGAEVGFRQDGGKGEKRRSQQLKATAEGVVRARRGDWRPAGMGGGGERRWAWVAAAETEQTGRLTGAGPADVEAQVSYNCDSEVIQGEERLDASDVPADGVWSNGEREGAEGLVSSDSLLNNSLPESSHQRAPAERPLSPACGHSNTPLTTNKLSDLSLKIKHTRCTSNIMPLPQQNTQLGVPSSSRREKEPWFILSEIPARTQVHSRPEVKVKMSILPQEETSTGSLSYTMDPLSMSLLQVDRQVATASFLRGEHGNTSLCPLENERGEDKRREVENKSLKCAEMAGKAVEDKDVEFRLSLLEQPQAKTHGLPTSDTMTATDHLERRKDMCFATNQYCGLGMMKSPSPEVMLVPLQDQENDKKRQTTRAIEVLDDKAPASSLKSLMCASMESSVTPSISFSGNTGSTSSHNLMTNGATQHPSENAHNVHNKPAFSISTPQSEGVLDQLNTLPKQHRTVHSNHSSDSDISLQPKSLPESNSQGSTSNLHIKPRIHLSVLEDLDQRQWRVVQAHWEQLEEMETLYRKEGSLLCQQPDMAFGEYVHKLGEIMERKAQCVHNMIAQLQPYLKTSHSYQPHNQGEENHDQIT